MYGYHVIVRGQIDNNSKLAQGPFCGSSKISEQPIFRRELAKLALFLFCVNLERFLHTTSINVRVAPIGSTCTLQSFQVVASQVRGVST